MKKYFLSLIIAASALLCGCRQNSEESIMLIPVMDSVCWDNAIVYEGFHAPWNGLDDNTSVRILATAERIFFRFKVEENSPCYVWTMGSERDCEYADRVEVFFSSTPDMSRRYHCAEVDVKGLLMDYSCEFYRQMDYEWGFESARTESEISKGGYTITMSFARSEIESFGCNLKEGFYLGLFRADYMNDTDVVFYSLLPTDDETPDFHQPKILIKARLEK